MTNLTFLNHACFKISHGDTSLTCDPWLFGTAFNNGWRLLVENEALGEIAAASKFIWLSHEHPDHFSIEFFKKFQPRQAKILFQWTRDKRVVSYFKKSGYEVIEIGDGEAFDLSPTESLMVRRNGHYDSWSLYRNAQHSILNLNDCHFPDSRELERMKRDLGPIDVLLTQFSYASWRGGRAHAELRRRSAAEKLETVLRQVRGIEPKFVIPFASFVYFSHQENSYLNDSVGTVDSFQAALKGAVSTPVILSPGDTWEVGSARDNQPSTMFWRQAYANVPNLPFQAPGPSVSPEQLRAHFDVYRRRVGSKNSLSIMRLLSLLPGLGAFRPFTIRLSDLGKTYRFSFWNGLEEMPSGEAYNVEMTSENLSFVFLNEFGYDTLTVNGRFEADAAGFRTMTKNFAIGSLNAMGLNLSPSFVKNLDVAWLLMKRLSGFSRKLRA